MQSKRFTDLYGLSEYLIDSSKGFKADREKIINLKAAINDHEHRRIDKEYLTNIVKLSRDPADYPVNNPNKKTGMLLGGKVDDIISYLRKVPLQSILSKLT